jgi:steroid 5-alpha reductase family enzyme
MNDMLWAFSVAIGINLFMFVPAFTLKTDKITDVSYAVTFMVLALYGFMQSDKDVLHVVVLLLMLAWALRLGGFLLMRIQKAGKDARFDGMRENFLLFLRFWVLQGATVFVVSLSALFAFKAVDTQPGLLSLLGALLFVKGLVLEATADMQKFAFSSKPSNKGKWIDTGVWRMSRHPNYLGEMLVWIGMYMLVYEALAQSDRLWALLSPLYIIGLLLFVSGVPLLEKSANKKWGHDAAYKAYKKEVPVLLPTLASVRRMRSK